MKSPRGTIALLWVSNAFVSLPENSQSKPGLSSCSSEHNWQTAHITAPTIPEVIRKIQSELFQYERVSQLVDPSVNVVGLEFVEADKVLILLRALPQPFRQWVVLNCTQMNLSRPMSIALFGTKHNSAFGPTSMASRLHRLSGFRII